MRGDDRTDLVNEDEHGLVLERNDREQYSIHLSIARLKAPGETAFSILTRSGRRPTNRISERERVSMLIERAATSGGTRKLDARGTRGFHRKPRRSPSGLTIRQYCRQSSLAAKRAASSPCLLFSHSNSPYSIWLSHLSLWATLWLWRGSCSKGNAVSFTAATRYLNANASYGTRLRRRRKRGWSMWTTVT